MGYVVTFRGRRDGYEVPLALAEHGLLDRFLTDYSYGPAEAMAAAVMPARMAEKLRARGNPVLAPMTTRLRWIAAREAMHHAIGGAAANRYDYFDPLYGRAAALAARRFRSDLFIYSPHADQAFRARYRHDPRKILFQFHPHIDLEQRLILADGRASGDPIEGIASPARRLADNSWRMADHIVCASSFTRRSLVEAGALPSSISVIPYGVDLPTGPVAPANQVFRALFVGSGIYRKGLHHLLDAWKTATLPAGATLTIVARVIEPALLAQLRTVPGVIYLSGLPAAGLARLYAESSLFVMPSIVEGFGQVYLEALAHGLPVLGTENSAVADLGTPAQGVFRTMAGQSDILAEQLAMLADLLAGNDTIRGAARAVAAAHSWTQFRQAIAGVAR